MAEHSVALSPALDAPHTPDFDAMSSAVPASPLEGPRTPPNSSPPGEPVPPPENLRARIGYRTEYRNALTKELIKEETSDTPQTNLSEDQPQELVFEVVKTYTFIPRRGNIDNDWVPQPITEPTFAIKLYSPAILNALKTVVKYYPNQELSGDIIIQAPYCVLVHHYDELQSYATERSATPPETLCVHDRFVAEHVNALIHFLDETVMENVRSEMERNARGFYTFAHAWVSHKPGRTMLNQFRSDNRWVPGVISSVSGGTFTSPPSVWTIIYWHLKYEGQYLRRIWKSTRIDPFDGETSLEGSCTRFIDSHEVEKSEDPIVQELISWGRVYCRLLKKQCMHHSGLNTKVPFQQIDGLVMADAQTAISMKYPKNVMNANDLRKGGWRCPCSVCQSVRNDVGESDFEALFSDYDTIDSETWEEELMTAHQYLLCPPFVRVFVFRTRAWGKIRPWTSCYGGVADSETERVHVKNLADPVFDEEMVNNLIIDKKKKLTLISLAKCFARRNRAEETIPKPMWSADFVEGKGTGLVFLLHGKPGVGKTLTAECIAAFTKRPLMILTASDVGTRPREVEANLSNHFMLAKSWGAVLLIDEADVFMERRSTADLERNSLVAGFLRALEYYEGILFLTTNRVGSFDDAFISRVHVQLYYPEFTEDQRQQVWQTFVNKLDRDRKGYMRLSYAAKEYIRESKKRDLKWNGREIRNAFQTAVSLAEYDAEKDEEGTILVTDQHLRAVVELSKDFKDYLKELHMADEDKRAQGRAERLDSFKGDKN
ncbi:P-loop containing nucleoside triphosphate hydrolase protein [Apiospora aurea]|uniref:P-loop containing nucleoside triphosphate hydrolase protein n=1 Tax=Apiospora aurea TaxID=335848 RepID=A0ABR1QPP8_9PEZI